VGVVRGQEEDMNAFLTEFAKTIGMNIQDAEEQWAGFSRQLSDNERNRIEARGARAGKSEGLRFLELYPKSEEE
jgi:hypothetical protein